MEQVQPKLTVGDVFGYALAYLGWLLTAAVGMLAIFQTRNMINALWPVLGGSRWVLRAIDRLYIHDVPCIIVAKALEFPPYLIERGDSAGVPVLWVVRVNARSNLTAVLSVRKLHD